MRYTRDLTAVPLCFGLVLVLSIPFGSVWASDQKEGFLLREDGRTRGSSDAPVTLMEYSDFTCKFCETFFQETWPLLYSEYVQTGKVRFVYRDFPRMLKGPSMSTAVAARCAGEQGRYWPMHDKLLGTDEKYDANQLKRHAEGLKLNTNEFVQCYQSGRYLEAIVQDQQEGGSLGIRGTPGFVLFRTRSLQDGPIMVIPGAFPFEVFKEQIDQLLQSMQSKGSQPISH